MFDAAGVATAVDAVAHDPTADAHLDTTDHAVDQKLLDAAAQATESGGTGTSTAQSAEPVEIAASGTPQAETAVASANEIMFVDGRVFDSEALIAMARPGVEIVRLDPNQTVSSRSTTSSPTAPASMLSILSVTAIQASSNLVRHF